jgi:hypothetical protein
MDRALLEAIGAFAEVFTNPVVPVVVLGVGFLLPQASRLRLAALLLGLVFAVPALLQEPAPLAAAAAILGSCAAVLLHAEVVLHFVLPICRLAWRITLAALRMAAMVLTSLIAPHAPAERNRSGAIDPEP